MTPLTNNGQPIELGDITALINEDRRKHSRGSTWANIAAWAGSAATIAGLLVMFFGPLRTVFAKDEQLRENTNRIAQVEADLRQSNVDRATEIKKVQADISQIKESAVKTETNVENLRDEQKYQRRQLDAISRAVGARIPAEQ